MHRTTTKSPNSYTTFGAPAVIINNLIAHTVLHFSHNINKIIIIDIVRRWFMNVLVQFEIQKHIQNHNV